MQERQEFFMNQIKVQEAKASKSNIDLFPQGPTAVPNESASVKTEQEEKVVNDFFEQCNFKKIILFRSVFTVGT